MTQKSATSGYYLSQTMLRVKDPQVSLDFYCDVLGLSLLQKFDFPEMKFSLYFLGYLRDGERIPEDPAERACFVFNRETTIELTHNWGTEDEPDFAYHNGNSQPQGFGHIGITVPDVAAACARLEKLGVNFIKRPDEGKMKDIAFISDPDGYWIEILSANGMAQFY